MAPPKKMPAPARAEPKAKVEAVIPAPAKSTPAKPAPPKKVKSKGKAIPATEKPAEKTAAGFAQPELVLPTNQTGVLNNLIAREMSDPSGPLEPMSDTVNTLVRLTNSMSKGEDIADIKTNIIRIVSNQPEKADVYQSVLNLINQERVTDAVVMRAGVEKVLKRSVARGDLSTSECLAVWEISNNIIQGHEAKAAKQNKAVDSFTVVEKVDIHTLETEQLVQKKWEGTTPQGRQIIRMKLFDLKRTVQTETTVQKSKAKAEPEEEKEPVIDVE